MATLIYRMRNVVALCKAEASEGVDSLPTAADAFPFEIESLEISSPYGSEDSNEATGTDISAAPTIIGQPITFKAKMRLKGVGAGTAYTLAIRPPAHALLQSCGLKGQFQAGVAAAALTAGTVNSATLAAGFAATTELYRGQRLILSGGAPAGAHPMITGYTAARVAALSDAFAAALTVATSAEIRPNWTYAPTSPVTAAERLIDQPSSTMYAHCDGLLYKLFGMRGTTKLTAESGKPIYMEFTGTGIWGGQSNVANPVGVVLANHSGPIFAMGSGISSAFLIDRKELPISNFTVDFARTIESFEDPNTNLGFGAGQIMGRNGMLECDPLKTLLVDRNHIAELETPSEKIGVIRAGQSTGNRIAVTMPRLSLYKVDMAQRKGAASETLAYRALSPGRDAAGRDGDITVCFD